MAIDVPNFPDDTQRVLSIGRTGSGKTQAACHELSFRSWDRMPWLIVDYKGDSLIQQIGKMDGVRTVTFSDTLSKNGLHIIRPLPETQDEIFDAYLWQLHKRGNVGIYVDEGYMVNRLQAMNAILTQGRSKRMPVIMLAQRPVWLTRFAFSEADFYQVFHLNDIKDRKKVQEIIPSDRADLENRLPEFYSLWYDVKRDQINVFSPVPPAEVILENFRERLLPKRVYL